METSETPRGNEAGQVRVPPTESTVHRDCVLGPEKSRGISRTVLIASGEGMGTGRRRAGGNVGFHSIALGAI